MIAHESRRPNRKVASASALTRARVEAAKAGLSPRVSSPSRIAVMAETIRRRPLLSLAVAFAAGTLVARSSMARSILGTAIAAGIKTTIRSRSLGR